MSVPTDRIPETAPPAHDAPPPAVLALDERDGLDLHREINTRRAQIENAELLRRIRSL